MQHNLNITVLKQMTQCKNEQQKAVN